MMKRIKINDKLVGEGQPCFIIAEAGVNHNGDITLARELIRAAGDAGADAVKFQTFKAEDLVSDNAEKAPYQKLNTPENESQIEMLKKLELKNKDFKELSRYTGKRGMLFLSTPFDMKSVDLLEEIGVPAYKVASGEINDLPLLTYIAQQHKPVILSTGMSTPGEIKDALMTIRREGTRNIVLLHCVSNYPTKMEDINLRAMATLRLAFKVPVGLSDHTLGITVPIAAVALGACVIEKHFTLDKKLSGPDHKASLEPGELKAMVKAIRDVEKAMGNGIKKPVPDEEQNKIAARRSIVAQVVIPRGTVITREMLAIKRPGSGLEPRYINSIIGRKAKQNMKAGEEILLSKLI